jgi:hypothetical protein
MDFYAKLKCVDAQFCPNITAGSACPSNLPLLQYSRVLLCTNGRVQEISIYRPIGQSDADNVNRRARMQAQQGPGGGVFSTMLSQLSQLEVFYLWDFLLVSGDIEEWVAAMPTSIAYVSLGSPMSLRGRLPTFARLTNLVELGITYSQISGTIPPAIGDLPKLNNLRLYGNRLTGTVPVLNNLSRLKNSGSSFRCEILDVGFMPDTNCISSCSNLPECCSGGTTRSCTFAPEPTTLVARTTTTTTTTSPNDDQDDPGNDDGHTAQDDDDDNNNNNNHHHRDGPDAVVAGFGRVVVVCLSSSLSQSLSTSQTVDAAIPQTTPTSGDGTTIGIAVGVSAAVLFLIAAIALLLWRRKRASSPARSLSTGAPAAASNYGVLSLQPRADYDIGRL